jgi:hypothetical protein
MLIDPEDCEEWELEVRAADLAAAEQRCQAIANGQPLTEVLDVTQATKTSYKGTYRFICWFRSERREDDDDRDN